VLPPRGRPLNILLLDFPSDKNRGDAAIHVGLVGLLRRRLPTARLTVMSAFGANQWPELLDELSVTKPLVDEVVGGFRPTFVPMGSRLWQIKRVRQVANVTAVLAGLWMLPVWPILAATPGLRSLLPRPMQRTLTAMRSADLVLWRGRNFRANSAGREPFEIWSRLYNPAQALMFGKPIACIGASVWPLRHPLARSMLRRVLGKAFFVSLRDSSSFASATVLLRDKETRLELLPDLSLATLAGTDTSVAERRLPNQPNRLGVTINEWQGYGQIALDGYVRALVEFLARFLERAGTEVVLIPQVTLKTEATGLVEQTLLRELATDRVRLIVGRPSVDELRSIYAGVDLLVATRMHSAIFALCQGTPVVTISYDAGGKWGVLDMMGASDLDVPFSQVSADSLTHKVESVWARREALVAAVQARLPALATAAQANVDIPVESFLEGADRTQAPAHRGDRSE
jgi:polysaccharide pyruvyl transferase WcaK-like protein